MSKSLSVYSMILSIIVGISCAITAYLANDTFEGNLLKFFLIFYWIFTIAGLIATVKNYEKLTYDEKEFFINPLYLFLPLGNIIAFILFVLIIFEHDDEHKKNIESIKEHKKMTKKYPQLISLTALIEILELLKVDEYTNREIANNKPMSVQHLEEMVIFLRKNHKIDELANLLMNYEFSFIKLITIYKESIAVENIILDELLIPSKILLQQFSNKVDAIQSNIEKNMLSEKEMIKNIETITKNVTKERLINEINQEIKFHEIKGSVI
jgi:hypothetical protein